MRVVDRGDDFLVVAGQMLGEQSECPGTFERNSQDGFQFDPKPFDLAELITLVLVADFLERGSLHQLHHLISIDLLFLQELVLVNLVELRLNYAPACRSKHLQEENQPVLSRTNVTQ